MGDYDGSEVCELVGTYMLNLLSNKYNKNDFGLYRDDGTAIRTGTENIQKIFKVYGLDIIIQCNIKIVNYLDVTVNLNDGSYKLYTKSNNESTDIHKTQTIHQVPSSKSHYP